MAYKRLMRGLLIVTALTAPALRPADLAGQTADQARLIFSVGLGQTSGGGTLWRVPQQPLPPSDTIDLNRHFRRSLSVEFSGTYFPGDHFGINVEAQFIGLGTSDGCAIVGVPSDSSTREICSSINGGKRAATSVAFSVGGVFRVASHQPIHPYLRANAGMVLSQLSFIKTYGTTNDSLAGLLLVPIYSDSKATSVSPYLSLGGGVVVAFARGYQLHFELRDNWVRLPAVAGPTSPGFQPPQRRVGKHLLSFLVGFDVVLERKRGRRY